MIIPESCYVKSVKNEVWIIGGLFQIVHDSCGSANIIYHHLSHC